ncbi:TPA: EamA-like transporter family protein, partial [Salmonella enterica]|nr:EamA-like transporter family protein [Salmonella enterica]
VASQLIGGLALDIARSHGVTLRAMVGPAFGALLLVIGAWLIAKRQF